MGPDRGLIVWATKGNQEDLRTPVSQIPELRSVTSQEFAALRPDTRR